MFWSQPIALLTSTLPALSAVSQGSGERVAACCLAASRVQTTIFLSVSVDCNRTELPTVVWHNDMYFTSLRTVDYTEFTVTKEFLSQYRYTAVLHLKILLRLFFNTLFLTWKKSFLKNIMPQHKLHLKLSLNVKTKENSRFSCISPVMDSSNHLGLPWIPSSG